MGLLNQVEHELANAIAEARRVDLPADMIGKADEGMGATMGNVGAMDDAPSFDVRICATKFLSVEQNFVLVLSYSIRWLAPSKAVGGALRVVAVHPIL